MKKSDILTLVNAGVLQATQHELSNAHGYKVFKFKSLVRKGATDIQDAETELQKECGIEDAAAFDARRDELRKNGARTADEQKELEGMDEKLKTYLAQREEMLKEEVTLDVKALPYDEWVKLQNENKAVELIGRKADVFSGIVEELLFGVLWNAPDEE